MSSSCPRSNSSPSQVMKSFLSARWLSSTGSCRHRHRDSLRWTRSRYPSLAAPQGAHQALPRARRYLHPRADFHRFPKHDPFSPTWPERGFSSSPRLPVGLITSMGSNLRITRSAAVGKEDLENLLSKMREQPLPTAPLGTSWLRSRPRTGRARYKSQASSATSYD